MVIQFFFRHSLFKQRLANQSESTCVRRGNYVYSEYLEFISATQNSVLFIRNHEAYYLEITRQAITTGVEWSSEASTRTFSIAKDQTLLQSDSKASDCTRRTPKLIHIGFLLRLLPVSIYTDVSVTFDVPYFKDNNL